MRFSARFFGSAASARARARSAGGVAPRGAVPFMGRAVTVRPAPPTPPSPGRGGSTRKKSSGETDATHAPPASPGNRTNAPYETGWRARSAANRARASPSSRKRNGAVRFTWYTSPARMCARTAATRSA